MSEADALLDACRKRARPIVMTTLAMIAGMSPVALGLGADVSFRAPMAIAVIGGLITSTALSLVIVPVVFTYVHHVRQRLNRLFASRTLPPVQPVPNAPLPSEPRPGWSEAPAPIRRSAR
jgi:predicted RND superfamily exporter protein